MPVDRFLTHAGGPFALIALTVALLVLAGLVRRLRPDRWRVVGRMSTTFGVYVGLTLLTTLVDLGGATRLLPALMVATDLMRAVTVVAMASTLIFDVVLPLLRVRVLDLTADLLTGAGYLLVSVAVLGAAGLELTGVLAASTVVAAVLTISLQSTLGNVIGGVAVQLEGSIRVGDWIQLENGRQGRVSSVRWRHTEVVTRDGDVVVVPNSTLLGSQVILLGKGDGGEVKRRQWVGFRVPLRHPPSEVVARVEEALRASPIPGAASTPLPDVVCVDLGRDGVAEYAARYWLTDLERDLPVDTAVRGRVHAALRRAGLPTAVPALDLYPHEDARQRRAEEGHAQALATVRAVDLFRGLTDAEREALAAKLVYSPFDAGEVVTHQGAAAHWLYLLQAGRVEIVTEVEGAAPRVVTSITAPGFFGEMGLLAGEPRLASVIAMTPVVCYRLDKHAFEQVLTQRPEMARELSEILAHRRVELLGVREGLDAAAQASREQSERVRILHRIREFFGIDD